METRNSSGLTPCGRAVLVEPYEPEIKTGMIQLPDHVQRAVHMVNQRAVVIAKGENCWHDEPSHRAEIGDHVLITRYAGFIAGPDVTLDAKTYRLVNDRDIFCKITPKEGEE